MRKKGIVCMVLGLLLIVAALFLAGYNYWEDKSAGRSAADILSQLEQQMPEEKKAVSAEMMLEYVLHPGLEMPTVEIQGRRYIGIIAAPTIDLELPVMSELNYVRMKKAPCRYLGSVYSDDLIIAGHSYSTHFGSLKNLEAGDPVYFTDVDGSLFCYEVAEIEVLNKNDVEGMAEGEWDLTLFTCTYDIQGRVTVRCVKTDMTE